MKKLTLGLLAAFAIAGCTTTIIQNSDTGSLRGTVKLYQVNGDSIADKSGAIAFVGGTGLSGTSNAQGVWQVDNIPAGIYSILLTKSNFDTDVVPQFECNGAGTQFLQGYSLYELPLDSIPFTATSAAYLDTVRDSMGFYDTITMQCNVVGPNANGTNPLLYFELAISNPSLRSDTSGTVLLPLPQQRPFTIMISPRSGILIDGKTYYAQLPYTRRGDTLHVMTRAVTGYPGIAPAMIAAARSPYIVMRTIVTR